MPFLTFKDTVKFRSLDTCTMHVTPPTKTSRLSNHPPCSTAHGDMGTWEALVAGFGDLDLCAVELNGSRRSE
jgi:hypothetical protein